MSLEDKYDKIYRYDNFITLTSEGLIKTYPIKTTIKLILRELGKLKIQAKVDSDNLTNTIFIKGYSNTFLKKDIKNLIRMISTCGYFPSSFGFYNENDILIDYINYSNFNSNVDFLNLFKIINESIENSFYTEIIIESNFNKLIKNVPDKLYHITKSINLSKILTNGICPRSLSKRSYHPDRVYLGYNLLVTKGLANQFGSGDYILFEIDMNKILINSKKLKDCIKIYDDPDFSGNGCYTHENIPPDNIKDIMKIKV